LKRSNRLVLLIGIFLAIVAFVLILATLGGGGGGGNSATPPPTTVDVVVAAKNVALGAKITQDAVTTKPMPIDQRPADSYTDPALVIGFTARASVTTGQLITSAIINGGGSITNIEVPAGYVGIAVQVDQTTGVGTLIKPGDRVDVITGLTGADKVPVTVAQPQASPRPGTTAAPGVFQPVAGYNPTTVKTIVEGLQVLGTLLPPPPTSASPAPSGGTTSSTSLNGQQEIVILAATAQQAEAIKFSQMDGTISLVLRSVADCQKPDGSAINCPIVPTTGITLRKMVDDFGVLPPQIIQVIQPTPYPNPPGFPARPYPSPSPTVNPSASPSTGP
jgi:Flp pilus assembly protein CpaB